MNPPRLPFSQRPRRLYYTGLFYAAESEIAASADETHRLINGTALQKKVRALKIQSLVFEKVHLARTHLLTSYTEPWMELSRSFVHNNFILELISQGILEVSARPGADAKSDTERVTERLRKLPNNFQYQADPSALRIVNNATTQSADGTVQSRQIVSSLDRILETMSIADPLFASTTKEILRRSMGYDSPFLHELFLDLGNKSDTARKFTRWDGLIRVSNMLYLQNGVDLQGDMIADFDGRLENISAAVYRGLDRRLYSSKVIEAVFKTFVKADQFEALLAGPVQGLLWFRQTQNGQIDWSVFMDAYFNMALSVTRRIELMGGRDTASEGEVIEIVRAWLTQALDETASAAVSASKVAGPAAGAALNPLLAPVFAFGLNLFAKQLGSSFGSFTRSLAHPDLSAFARRLVGGVRA